MKVGDMVWINLFGGAGRRPYQAKLVYVDGDECVLEFPEEGRLTRLHSCRLDDVHEEKPIPEKVKELAGVISNVGTDPIRIAEHLYYGGWIRD